MKIMEEFEVCYDGKIQIAQRSKGVYSNWPVDDDSIRLAWYKSGKFDPISSSELPIWGLKDLRIEVVNRYMFSREYLANLVGILVVKLLK
jgi:hypothetical protein